MCSDLTFTSLLKISSKISIHSGCHYSFAPNLFHSSVISFAHHLFQFSFTSFLFSPCQTLFTSIFPNPPSLCKMTEFVLSPLTSCPFSYWHHGTVTARDAIFLLLLLSCCWSRREKGLTFCCLPVPHIDSPLSHFWPLSSGTPQTDPSAVSPHYHHSSLLPATTHMLCCSDSY